MINFLHKLPFTFCILLSCYSKLSDLVVLSSLCSVFHETLPLWKKLKQKQDLFNGVIDHEFWLGCLKQNVNYLNGALKKQFDDEPLLYLKIRGGFPTLFRRLSIFSVFEHLFYCTRTYDKKKDFCKLSTAINIINNDESRMFEDIAIDERDFTTCFHKFFERKSLFSLKLCSMFSFCIKVDLARKHHCIHLNIRKNQGIFLFVF